MVGEITAAWSFSSKPPGAASWAGNTGYKDELGSHYIWDSGVANHKQVAPGHVVILRNAGAVLGFGWIEEITREPAAKERRRCPFCSRTRVEPREAVLPRYRCYNPACKAEFDEPAVSEEPVTRYTGFYGRSWSPLIGKESSAVLEGAYLDGARQNAIRGLSPEWVRSLIEKYGLEAHGWTKTSSGIYEIPGGHSTGTTKVRRGQGAFRKALLERFGPVCAISGEQPCEVLEAAHLYSYATTGHHDALRGGLLLRRDLHALFDCFLIGIDPSTWTVRIGDSIRDSATYAKYDGVGLKVPAELRPDAEYLQAQLKRVLGER